MRAAPSGGPEMAVVVMAYGIRPTLPAAVRSVQTQAPAAEVIVVHSGPGDAAALLRQAGVSVRVVRSETRLLPGGARNLGIAETRAPWIAFLADDCIAEPGWISRRLAAHREGHQAVASALLCHAPGNPVALAAHLSLFVRRMPHLPGHEVLLYGVSYARSLFDRYGLFRDDIEGGEDTELNARLGPADRPVWRPEVLTTHCGVTRLGPFLAGQARRGRRMAESSLAIGRADSAGVARNVLRRTGHVRRLSRLAMRDEHRVSRAISIPLIWLGNMAYAWGAWRTGRKP